MKRFIILLLFISFVYSLNAQKKAYHDSALISYVLDGDTSIYYRTNYDYKVQIQVKATGLDAVDATIGFKQYQRFPNTPVYLTSDTISGGDGASKFTIDDADYSKTFQFFNTLGDSILIELKNNSVTSGTIDIGTKLYRNNE